MELHEFSTRELTRAKRRLNQKYFSIDSAYINKEPVGVLLGGQPASGKTGLFDRVKQANPAREFVIINGDEYRQYHPRVQEIDEEYGQGAFMTKRIGKFPSISRKPMPKSGSTGSSSTPVTRPGN